MRPLLLTLLAALALSSAPTADAQIGRLLGRARDAAREAVSDRTDEARESVEAATDWPPARADGAPAPAIDFGALLDIPFSPERGMFNQNSFGKLPMLFPPPGTTDRSELNAGYRIRTASGSVVGRQTLSSAVPTRAAAIVLLRTRAGVAGDGQTPLEPGQSYTLDVDFYGDVIGSVPFTVSRSQSDDPYRPTTIWAIDGPWRTHAYFDHSAEELSPLTFNAWVGPDDGPDGEKVEVAILRGGREVAWGKGGSIGSSHSWLRRRFELYPTEFRDYPDGRQFDSRYRRAWTIQNVTAGTYEIVLSTESGPFRTFTIEATDGGFVPHPRSDLNHEPHSRYLTTRQLLDMYLGRTNDLDHPRMLHWIGPEE